MVLQSLTVMCTSCEQARLGLLGPTRDPLTAPPLVPIGN